MIANSEGLKHHYPFSVRLIKNPAPPNKQEVRLYVSVISTNVSLALTTPLT